MLLRVTRVLLWTSRVLILVAREIVRHAWLDWHHNVWTTGLEAKDVSQALTFTVEDGLAHVVEASSSTSSISSFSFRSLGQQVTFWPQMVGLLQVKDWRLSE